MNTRFLLAVCAFVILAAVPSQAAPKKGSKPAGAVSAPPSAQLERLLSPCLEAILAPLQQDPKMPRVQVETLRSTFAGGQVKATTPGQQQIYQNAMNVCTALTTAMDDRAKSKTDALSSAKLPSISNGSGIIKSSPVRGVDAGANAQAIRKKQQDERKYADKLGHQQSAFIETVAYKSWTDKAAHLRQNVMALYTRQIQLEALEEKNAAATATKPAPQATKPADKGDAAKEAAYLGNWATANGAGSYIIKEDHTAIKMTAAGEKVDGTWAIEADGDFHVKWKDHFNIKGKLSADGQTIQSSKSSFRIVRKP
jgi:hypothetical protein